MSGNRSGAWSADIRKRTREVLTGLPIHSFIRNSECYMKNVDGRYGSVHLADLLRNDYRVCILEKREKSVESFSSVDDLIDSGWAVD